MSTLRVTSLTNYSNDGGVELTKGATIPDGYDVSGDVTLNTAGVCTATSFQGDGPNVTNAGVNQSIPNEKLWAYSRLF